jgi:hypothetical protein
MANTIFDKQGVKIEAFPFAAGDEHTTEEGVASRGRIRAAAQRRDISRGSPPQKAVETELCKHKVLRFTV